MYSCWNIRFIPLEQSMFFMDIIKMVIKIKIQLTFLIKFCVTDLAVSTSVIVNMSRFIPRIVLDHNGHFCKYTAVVKESQCTMLLSKIRLAKNLAIFLY